MATTLAGRLTPEDVWRMLLEGALSWDRSYELVDGELVEMSAATMPHQRRIVQIVHEMRIHLDRHGGGRVYAEQEVVLPQPRDRHRMRKPDVVFCTDRTLAEAGGEPPTGFPRIVPDLVVELVSPGDLAWELAAKLVDYLRAGVRVVWIVDALSRSATICRADRTARVLLEEGALEAEEVLPGFRLELGALLE